MDSFFIKVLHEEPMDKLTLQAVKGGVVCGSGASFVCYCNGEEATFTCSCHGKATYCKSFFCPCNCTRATNSCECNGTTASNVAPVA